MTVHAMECVHRSHVGLVRPHNEDHLVCFPGLGIMVLGDGMGGHHAGEVASRIAVEAAAEELMSRQEEDWADELDSLLVAGEAVEAANLAVCAEIDRYPQLKGMGTTLVVALFRENNVYFAHVGDSRLYCLRDGRLRQLTRDHSLVQELLDNGLFATVEEAHDAGIGDNILTRSIGLDPGVEIDVGDQQLHAGDLYLMCSDGLCGRVPDQTIGRIMQQSDDLDTTADALLLAALEAGGRDNISLILGRVQEIS
jgi:protein phosphatase